MNKERLFFRPIVYGIILIYITLTYSTLALGNSIASMAYPEDHYFELVGAGSLLISAVLIFYSFIKIRRSSSKLRMPVIKQLVYVGLIVLFVFGAGEEISWGQRIFNLKTPQFLMHDNTQEELNLHNLSIFENSDFFTADRIFDIFWFLFVVIIPVASLLFKPVKKLVSNLMPIIHWSIGPLFLFNYVWAKLAKLIYQGSYTFDRVPFKQAIQEIKESNYEILFVLIGLFILLDLNRSKIGESNLSPTL